MQLTQSERAARENAKARIQSVVHDLWPDAEVREFGSAASGLALPNSDIDMMVFGVSDESRLRMLEAKLVASNITEPNSIQARDNVRVPIIEFIERQSQINIDMPFFHGPSSLIVAEMLNEYQRKYPALAKLLFVLKQYLKQRQLNDVFTGLISQQSQRVDSFSCNFCSIIFFRWNFIICYELNVHQLLASEC